MLQQYWEETKKLLDYARYCADHDIQTAVCRDFWLWIVYAAVGLGLLIALKIGRKILREQREFRRNRKRLEARAIAEEEEAARQAMRKAQATPEVELTQEELAATIGQALKVRSQEAASSASKEQASGKSEAAPQRELAAIMLTDMAGYSESMERDEERAYAQLLDHNKIVRSAIANYRGREIKTIGDAFLVIFRSAVDAVDCAVAIQRAFTDYNLAKDGGDRILIRIGVHLGEVMITSNDVYGDGVNIAARIEPLAAPGGICISGEVFAQVRKKLEFKLERLEGVQMKNIAIAPDIYRVQM